jgi:hypothetical protein
MVRFELHYKFTHIQLVVETLHFSINRYYTYADLLFVDEAMRCAPTRRPQDVASPLPDYAVKDIHVNSRSK